ncbi:MAG: hypothetical protein K1X57_19825 [Gemmataceae bacterium]|nr:hypothetical protein [Gemmataceae bacterium]
MKSFTQIAKCVLCVFTVASAQIASASERSTEKFAADTLKGLATLTESRPRVAVLAFGDENGGRPQKLNPKLAEMEVKFLRLLRDWPATPNKPYILGPDAIANELKSLNREGNDLATLTPAHPDEVSRWLREELKGAIDVLVFARIGEDKSEVTLISKDENKKVAKVTAPFGWSSFRGVTGGTQVADNNPVVKPELFAVPNGGNPRPIPLMRKVGEFDPITYAIIPKDLEDAMSRGELLLEIRLTRTGSMPPKDVVSIPDPRDGRLINSYRLKNDPQRLFPVAVQVNERGTIAEQIEDHQNNGKWRSSFVAREPELMRKWVLTQPGYAVIGVAPDGRGVVSSVAGEGNAVVTIRGFQNAGDTANTFVLRKPDEGASTKLGINASTGLIRVTVFLGKCSSDAFLGSATTTSTPGGKVDVETGTNFIHQVRRLKVPIYPQAAEEHVIQLCTELQRDPNREDLTPYPPIVTK